MTPGETVPATTLAHVVQLVGAQLLSVLAAPKGLSATVRGTVVRDPSEPLPHGPEAILLASGLSPQDGAVARVLRRAAQEGYAAVVIKQRRQPCEPAVAAAVAAGIAMLVVPDAVPWRHLDALLLSALGSWVGDDAGSVVGEQLFAVADAVAGVTRGSVAIEDLERNVLAYSSLPGQRIDELRKQGILARQVPAMERNLWQYAAVLAAGSTIHFDEVPDEMARSAVAIRAGRQVLGTMWAIEQPGGLPAGGRSAMLDGARLAAIHLLRHRNAFELALNARDTALHGALTGSWTAGEVAFRLGLRPGRELSLVGFAAHDDGRTGAAATPAVAGALLRHFAAYQSEASLTSTAHAVYVLLPGSGEQAARRLAGAALAGAPSDLGVLRAAVCSTSDPSRLPSMRTEVDDVLAVTTRRPGLPAVAGLADVHALVVLAQLADVLAARPGLRHPGLTAMRQHDDEHGTAYVSSVLAWLNAVGDVARAASVVGVHPNTLRYRLRRADGLFHLGLDEPDQRLSAWLQLRLLERPGAVSGH